MYNYHRAAKINRYTLLNCSIVTIKALGKSFQTKTSGEQKL